MKIAFFGSSLVSAYWNGAATYYRGILRALAARGHQIVFYEPDAYDRQRHRDIDDPPWAEVVVYGADGERHALRALEAAKHADLVVKASGVGVHDALLERAVADLRSPRRMAVFWDVDAPATLARLRRDPNDPFVELIPRYDAILTYGGGPKVIEEYVGLAARVCVPIYNAHDPDTHHPVARDPRFACRLGFLGNRMPDREARVRDHFFGAAARVPEASFVLGGSGWQGDPMLPDNVRALGHVYTADHNAFNCSSDLVLNVSRESMAETGYSPATRVFEAAAAGACVVTDAFDGIEQFFEPGREILVARGGEEVAELVRRVDTAEAGRVGAAARGRVLAEHRYADRVHLLERVLDAEPGRPWRAPSAGAPTGSGAGADASAGVDRDSGAASERASISEGRLRIVMIGLSITSSWGNGHATTYRALCRALGRLGHDVLFLERDVPWYAEHRDDPDPDGCTVSLYGSLGELFQRHTSDVADADVVMVGSFVPEGVAVTSWVTTHARGVTAFYDIDTPVTLAKFARGDHEYLSPAQIPELGLYLSFTGGPTLRHLRSVHGARLARPLYCGVDEERYRPFVVEPMWDLGYLGTYSDDRQPALEALLFMPALRLPAASFVVAGSRYPAELTWPANVARVEHVAPPDHPGFYNSQRFTLNLTRLDMKRRGWSPSVRLFEAAACGIPIITDEWEGFESFFEIGSEILVARDADDVVFHLAELDETKRHALGQRGRQRVLASHTAMHRARALLSYVDEAREAASSAVRPSAPGDQRVGREE